jgi:TonB family protein
LNRLRIPIFLLLVSIAPRAAPAQQSFYVVRHFFSDDLSSWNEKVLDVTQAANDVRVRFTQIALAEHYCSALLVQTAERVLPRTSVREVAGANLCAITESGVRRAIRASQAADQLTEAASQLLHVECGTSALEFEFPFDSSVDQKKLARSFPQVAALQRLIYHVRDVAFAHSFWFEPDAQLEAREQLGLSMVPELTSGKYDNAIDGGLLRRLKAYTIPPPDLGPRPQLVNADALHLTKYETPAYPSIALAARIQGDVRLRLSVDLTTGAVIEADVLSGQSLINKSASDAAKSWRFDPSFLTARAFEVTVRYSMDC